MARAKRGFTFNQMEVKAPGYSKYNLSHEHKTTCNAGKLIPIFWTEGLPGDKLTINIFSLTRLQALSSPMMHREDQVIRLFKVPLRILVDSKELEQAFTGGKSGQHLNFPMVECDITRMTTGSLYDYLGLPLPYFYKSNTDTWEMETDGNIGPAVSPFPFLAYHRIFHDWFRNEDTADSYEETFEHSFEDFDGLTYADIDLNAYDQDLHLDSLLNVNWERDYFTSALASSQRGRQVSVPLVGTAQVKPGGTNYSPIFSLKDPASAAEADDTNMKLVYDGNTNEYLPYADAPAADKQIVWKESGLVVDGSTFTGIGAIALRMAMNLQAFLERNNVAGYRYIENILAHFGVKSSDARLDYAEYLGGLRCPIQVSAVTQQSATTADGTPQGTLTGNATAVQSGHLGNVYCEEHCIIMAVMYILPRTGYSQGLSRAWTRKQYTDYYWQEFQTVGEQEIQNGELFWNFYDGDVAHPNDETWAYQSRYSEYKYIADRISGDFRTSLSYWHKSRLFTSLPLYNNEFVQANPTDRVFAVKDDLSDQHYLCDFWFDIQAVRPMSKYAQSKIW